MTDKNETAAFENPTGTGGNKDTNGKPRYRRRRHNRTGTEKDTTAPAQNAADTERDIAVRAAGQKEQAEASLSDPDGETVHIQSESKKDRGRRHMRNNRSKGTRRAAQENIAGAGDAAGAGTEESQPGIEAEDETVYTYTRAAAYTESERDIVGREIYEAVTEERIEKAVLEAVHDADEHTAPDAAETDRSDADEDGDGDVRSEETDAETDVSEKVPVEVVGVRFKAAGKVYYFDPDGAVFREGDTVIVETARGIEFGFVVGGNRTVMASEIVSPLKKVLRSATDEDRAHYEENNRRREEAFVICREKIAEHGIEMKLVDVEYTFDNNKLLFYFTADGRVDFRELVKDLASVFRTRIELRQIGIRDEAKLMGGLGVCGRPFCCHSFLSDFVQVSIKMAKEQNLSLNSAKISGTCGRLMCCLRYEYDVYEEELKKTPKMDAVVETPDGEGVVCEVIPLAGLVRVRFLGNRSDVPPKLYHRDDLKVRGKMNWKSGTITYHDENPNA